MSDNSNGSGGANTNTGGEGENQQDNKQKPDTVSRDAYEKLLDEKKKLAEQRKAQDEELKKYRDADEEKKRKDLESKGEYEKAIALEREARKKSDDELESYRKKDKNRTKLAAVLDSVGGTIDSKFYGLIDYEDVVLDPESGDVNEMSVTKVVENLKKKYPEIIKTDKGAKMPDGSPRGAGGGPNRISIADFEKLSVKDQQKYKFDQIDF